MGSSPSGKETIRDQLIAVWKQTGIKPPELEPAGELNEMFYDAWQFFLKLHSKRSNNGFGVNPISYLEMKAFFELHEIYPTHYELELIEQFDNVALEIHSKQQQEKQKQHQNKSKK